MISTLGSGTCCRWYGGAKGKWGRVMGNPMIPREVEQLLYDLCVHMGFCLPPEESARLRRDPPPTVDEFINAVFRAEGTDPETHHQYRDAMRRHVVKHFRAASDP